MKRLLCCLLLSFCLSLTVSAQAQSDCADAPEPQLVVGQWGRVLPGPANNVRDIPTVSGALIGEIPGGEVFTVLNEPECGDGLWWWQVEYGGMTGWTAEGRNTYYYPTARSCAE